MPYRRKVLLLAIFSAGLALFGACSMAFSQLAPEHKPSSTTPLMAQLFRFTSTRVPAIGPAEIAIAPLKGDQPIPSGLPGRGMNQHPMLYIGEGYNKIILVNNGKIIWTYSTGSGNELDDVWML